MRLEKTLESPLDFKEIKPFSPKGKSTLNGNSAGKESDCNSEYPGFIPELGRSPGEGIGYPLQYSWASLVAQMIKKPPAMWENWVPSLGWKDALEEGMATPSSILAKRIPTDRGSWQATVYGVAKSQTRLSEMDTGYRVLLD